MSIHTHLTVVTILLIVHQFGMFLFLKRIIVAHYPNRQRGNMSDHSMSMLCASHNEIYGSSDEIVDELLRLLGYSQTADEWRYHASRMGGRWDARS